jgi:GT2 family glycosyltransferase
MDELSGKNIGGFILDEQPAFNAFYGNTPKEPKVAIFLSVKNSEKTLNDCINSLLALDYPNYKIFIFDAKSRDKSWDIILNKWHENREKIETFRYKMSLPQAYNFLIDKIDEREYPFIAFTDADCIVEKNWLTELMKGYDKDAKVIAVAGKVLNPKRPDNRLQELIGRELEYRYSKFSKFIPRAATMNLSVKTKFAKQTKFDERLEVVQETDWGYRLTKLGGMLYNPKAVVRHRHRATWKGYFKQQFRYGIYTPLLYLKHMNRVGGDNVSTTKMIVQPFLIGFGFLGLLFGIFFHPILIIAILLFLILIGIYQSDVFKLSKKIREEPYYYAIFFIRTVAWTLGLLVGMFKLIVNKW